MLDGLEPRDVFAIFETLFAGIPRPSGRESAVREAILGWAAARGLATSTDAAGNVVVRAPASPGKDGVPALLFQGHMDMVCETDLAGGFDFESRPVTLRVDGEWLAADGTTLGADNGLGASMALALLVDDDPAFVHGPIEVLLTVAEETGLDGALAMDPATLGITAGAMVNVDSEQIGEITIGSAGGGTTTLRCQVRCEPCPPGTRWIEIAASGLRGGHSGVDIHLPRANAIKLVARVLNALPAGVSWRLHSWEGGTRHNAIPRSSSAVAGVPPGVDVEDVLAPARAEIEAITRYHARAGADGVVLEPSIAVHARDAGSGARPALDAGVSRAVVALVSLLPHGPATRSPFLPGLVETSSNLATVSVNAGTGKCGIDVNTRSSEHDHLEATRRAVSALAGAMGWDARLDQAYPGWSPDPASPFLAMVRTAYEESAGIPVQARAIHAGLECSIISGKLPALAGRVVSIGPTILHPHSPAERARIGDVAIVQRVLKAIATRWATGDDGKRR